MSRDFVVNSIPGQSKFDQVHRLQLDLLEKRIRDEIPDTLIVCEHQPVITRGRGLQRKQDSISNEPRQRPLPILPVGTDYFEIERGGDLTWHGPGQLVAYPIFKLQGPDQDIDRWIRFLEATLIRIFSKWGVVATTRPGGSGVWIGNRKIASVGIALRKWVNYHGIALNILNDLSSFDGFDPCGFESKTMTRAKEVEGVPSHLLHNDWRKQWEPLWIDSFRIATDSN